MRHNLCVRWAIVSLHVGFIPTKLPRGSMGLVQSGASRYRRYRDAGLQTGRTMVRVSVRSMNFFSTYLILLAALGARVYSVSDINIYQNILLVVKLGRSVRLKT
jgi:hypothetical protein